MRSDTAQFASPQALRAARHLASLVREARLARRMPQTELATRARSTQATVHRVEHASVQASLGTWLQMMEQLGLLPLILALKDPTAEALRAEQGPRRARRSRKTDDLDF